MAKLKDSDKRKLESYFEMKSGYVCDFSNSTFGDFVLENSGIDLYKGEYSGSKATRLRAFWDREPNNIVAKLLTEMIEYWKQRKESPLYGYNVFNPPLYEDCKKIVLKLQKELPVEGIDALKPNSTDRDFGILAKSIKESIEKRPTGRSLG